MDSEKPRSGGMNTAPAKFSLDENLVAHGVFIARS
jgi:hypothetical protein